MEEKKKAPEKTNVLTILKQLWKSPRGRSILYLIGYAIFFAVLIVTLRSHSADSTKNNMDLMGETVYANYKLDGIEAGNYYFNRTETINGITTTFEGMSNADRSDVMMSRNNQLTHYFMYGSIVIQEVGEAYQVAVQPYQYPKLGNYAAIQSMLNQATLISKTDYNEANTIYHYEISTTTLSQILDGEVIDIADQPNTIDLEVDKEQNVVGITYQLDAYATYKANAITQATIQLTYHDFGKVEPLEIPN